MYVKIEGVTKTFGTVIANNNIDFSVEKGEIHALLGENGSGKSTLMNILSGIYMPDSGSIFIDGKKQVFRSPADSIRAGIGMVHQHFKLVEVMTAKENIVIGAKRGVLVRNKKLSGQISEVAQKYQIDVDPDKKVYNMSVGEKQSVEILKVLYRGADILILDEPTAVLTPQEIKKLFQNLLNMKNNGCAVIIITHKLNEVMEISDRVTVLRKGSSVVTYATSGTNINQLTEMMVGRPVDLSIERPECQTDQKILSVKKLNVVDKDGSKMLNDVSFDLFSGEILGVAGVAGSGQKELCECLAGLTNGTGQVLFKEESLIGKNPAQIINMGVSMSFIPEDRLGMGLVASMDIVDNVVLKGYKKSKGPFVDRKTAEKTAEKIVADLSISTPGLHYPVKMLSGGNIQKVLLGREINISPVLLITAYPVRGLDINSSMTIYNLLNREKQRGVAILFVGEDLDVLMELCDRIIVLCNGKITGEVLKDTASKEQIGLLMAGITEKKAEGYEV